MPNSETDRGPIMRLFEVRAKKGCAEELMRKFATTSAEVVRGEPGNQGYFFGHDVGYENEFVVFASIWRDLDAIKNRFGEDWQKSFLPPGYEAMIERCSVRHIDLSAGWHVNLMGAERSDSL